jgi:hypothetical protein
MHNKFRIAALASAMFVLTQPVQAADAGADAASTGSSAAGAASASGKKAAPVRYCLNIDVESGTRVPQRRCKTQEEWSELGVEVKAKR